MAVTPNYGWPVPVATDYVKDGYAAIADLGDAIDATVFALPAGSLTLVTASTFSAVSAVNINSCFTSTYQNYKILISCTAPTGEGTFSLRLRVGGVDSTSIVQGFGFRVKTTSVIAPFAAGGSSINLFQFDKDFNSGYYAAFVELINPQIAAPTNFNSSGTGFQVNDDWQGYFGNGYHSSATAYDGFSIYPSAGNISGNVKVYGYSN